jgi:hypothetical protein
MDVSLKTMRTRFSRIGSIGLALLIVIVALSCGEDKKSRDG